MKSTGKMTKMVLRAGLILLAVFSTRAVLAWPYEDCDDTTPPTIEILSPQNGDIVGRWVGTDTLCATVDDYNPCGDDWLSAAFFDSGNPGNWWGEDPDANHLDCPGNITSYDCASNGGGNWCGGDGWSYGYPDGPTTLWAVAWDASHNRTVKTVTFTIDNTPPTLPTTCYGWSDFSSTTSIISGGTYAYSSPFFEWSGATDATSGIEGYYVYYGTEPDADPATQGTFQSACTYEVSEDAMTPGNTYYLRVKTRDRAGNTLDVGDIFIYDAFTYTYCGAYISSLLGEVDINNERTNGEWLPARSGECLQDGDMVRTGGTNSSAVITFADGSEIKLDEMSFLKMGRVKHCSEIETLLGRIWARITGDCFYVRTPSGGGAVRGTEFEVDVAEDGTSTFIVLDGVVEVSDLAETKSILVVQYQTTTVEPKGIPSDTQSIDLNEIDRWWECVVDSDSDGMDDCWEEQYGLNPDDPTDAELDNNGDGFTNLQEYNAGTNPNDPDDYPPTVQVAVDIKPGSCLNPLNIKSRGVLPVAILGSEDVNVEDIDVLSIKLAGVAPNRSSYEDVATAVYGDEGECITEEPDGILDLTLKFDTQAIVNAISEVADGDELILELTGLLHDDTPIVGEDFIIILAKGK